MLLIKWRSTYHVHYVITKIEISMVTRIDLFYLIYGPGSFFVDNLTHFHSRSLGKGPCEDISEMPDAAGTMLRLYPSKLGSSPVIFPNSAFRLALAPDISHTSVVSTPLQRPFQAEDLRHVHSPEARYPLQCLDQFRSFPRPSRHP